MKREVHPMRQWNFKYFQHRLHGCSINLKGMLMFSDLCEVRSFERSHQTIKRRGFLSVTAANNSPSQSSLRTQCPRLQSHFFCRVSDRTRLLTMATRATCTNMFRLSLTRLCVHEGTERLKIFILSQHRIHFSYTQTSSECYNPYGISDIYLQQSAFVQCSFWFVAIWWEWGRFSFDLLLRSGFFIS